MQTRRSFNFAQSTHLVAATFSSEVSVESSLPKILRTALARACVIRFPFFFSLFGRNSFHPGEISVVPLVLPLSIFAVLAPNWIYARPVSQILSKPSQLIEPRNLPLFSSPWQLFRGRCFSPKALECASLALDHLLLSHSQSHTFARQGSESPT